ncbi:hypothetical protein L873DRAFT_1794022 [Choiromyces venosus 120613-1]|uniref:Uncharacterized protein n=1 Tax=Choiromyces venosus 120613-1 TaxID=1336337 RepID=A0A3N4J3G0_9PEZI|nr:hypothetical protein L873DRAFT_1794022 [Choiromyces venosus 120613-1]
MTTFPPTPDASPKVKNSLLLNSAPSPASSTSSVTLADEPPLCVSTEDDNSPSPLAASSPSLVHSASSPTTPQSITKSPKCTKSETVPRVPPPPPSSAPIGNSQRSPLSSSSSSSTIKHDTAVGFDSLPLTVLTEIFRHALRGDCGEISYSFLEYTDPRFLNHNFCAVLERRILLARLSRVNKFARAYLQPHLYSPAVVTSMAELNSLSGYYYPEVDWKKKGAQQVFETDGNANFVKPRLPAKRRKVFRGPGRKIKDLVVIIAGLPGGMLEDNHSARWPGWYLEDFMRYDLEALAVERLTILAPSQVTAATVLCATIPNYQTIKHLHIEVNSGEPAFAPEPRFYTLAAHDSSRDHLCPRLVLHNDTLESLTLRNIHICRHLFDQHNTWRRLRHLNLTFHNGLRGLCCSPPHHPSTSTLATTLPLCTPPEHHDQIPTPETEVQETNRKLWDFCHARQYLTVEIFAWYDFWSMMPGETAASWRTISGLLYRRLTPGGQLVFSPYEWWKAIADGTGPRQMRIL